MQREYKDAKQYRRYNFCCYQFGLAIFAGQDDGICASLVFTGKDRRYHNADSQQGEHQQFKAAHDDFPAFVISILQGRLHLAAHIAPVFFFLR